MPFSDLENPIAVLCTSLFTRSLPHKFQTGDEKTRTALNYRWFSAVPFINI
jgi:hypothetical protein